MSQRLIMTPQMQQSIQLLQLSTLELTELVQQEMAENPCWKENSLTAWTATWIWKYRICHGGGYDTPVSDLIETGRIELDELGGLLC